MSEQTASRGARWPASIGRYRIIDRLGKGAMGIVYRARDEQLARDVALKLMMTDLEQDPETRARFFREAQITSRLVHRNIVTVLDVGEDDGRLFIVMELLKGQTLGEFLKNAEPAMLEQKVDLMIQACDGFSMAHSKGIVHRDIKPGNLFVLTDGGLKILDFGVARLASSTMTASGLIIGTPDYMSPEQARGKEVDGRSDIFSAAAVFYLMLTGRKPFEAASLPAVLQKVVREDPLPIREHEAPPALARIIMKGLSKEPADRYARFTDVEADLVRFRRQFDSETRQFATQARERFAEVQRLAQNARDMRDLLTMPPAAELEEQAAALRAKYPFGGDAMNALPAVLPFRRQQVMAMLADFQEALPLFSNEVERLRSGVTQVERAERSLAARDAQAAIDGFNRAQQILIADSARVSTGLASAQALLAELRALERRVQELLAEANAAHARRSWNTVVDRASEILEIWPGQVDASVLINQAQSALAAEAESRRRHVQQLLERVEKALKRERFDEAAHMLGEARALGENTDTVADLEGRLTSARIAAAAHDEKLRRAAEEIAATRAMFDVDREAAIVRLAAFAEQNPDAADVASELRRMRLEAERIADAQARHEAAMAHVQQAETYWSSDEVTAALRCAELALSLEPALDSASRLQTLARAKLRERAESAAKAAQVTLHVAKGTDHLASGRFDKALREGQAALALDPTCADALELVNESERLESQAEIARREQTEARAREKELAASLKSVQRAIRAGDWQKAVWLAENVVSTAPDNPEAQEALATSRDGLAASLRERLSTDETVRFSPDGEPIDDPDGTVTMPPTSSSIRALISEASGMFTRWRRMWLPLRRSER
jgi:serine/threonine protein kinase